MIQEKNPRQTPLVSTDVGRWAGFHPKGEDGHSDSTWLWVAVAERQALEGQLSSVQLLSHVQLFVTPWITAHQASLSFTISGSLLKLMAIVSVMPSNHLILCCPLLLLPSIFPSKMDSYGKAICQPPAAKLSLLPFSLPLLQTFPQHCLCLDILHPLRAYEASIGPELGMSWGCSHMLSKGGGTKCLPWIFQYPGACFCMITGLFAVFLSYKLKR